MQKYLKEVSLLNQAFVKNDKQTVEQMLKAANTTVKGFTLYVVGEGIEKKADDFAAEVAAQVAAAKQAASRPAGPGLSESIHSPGRRAFSHPVPRYTHHRSNQENPPMPQPAHKRILLKLSGRP